MSKFQGFVVNGVGAGDQSGEVVAFAGDVNGDGIDDFIIGAQNDTPSGLNSGATYVVFGSTDGFDRSFELSSLDGVNGFRLVGANLNDFSGASVSSAGDVNGDGIDDILIGAPGANAGDNNNGETYVVFGSNAAFDARFNLSSLDGSNGFRINGIARDDFSGRSVSSAGDLNGDGIDDIIVGAPAAGSDGEVYVVFGSATEFDAGFDLSTLDGSNGFTISDAASTGETIGNVSLAGDVNGDGIGDILIGAASDGDDDKSEAYVVFGSITGFDADFDLSSLDGTNGFKLTGASPNDFVANKISSAGDVNGDGIDDIIILSTTNVRGTLNSADVVFGTSDGFDATLDRSSLDGTNGFTLSTSGTRPIRDASSAGDVNGDGIGDMLLREQERGNAGNTYLVFGTDDGFDASFDLSSLDGSNGYIMNENNGVRSQGSTLTFANRSVSSAGDVNGDGYDDILIGRPYVDPNGTESGQTIVVFGGQDNLSTIDGRNGAVDGRIDLYNLDDRVFDTLERDNIAGLIGLRDDYIMLDDGEADILSKFDFALDKIDMTAFGPLGFDDLTLKFPTDRDGIVKYIEIYDPAGDLEIRVRFFDDAVSAADALDASQFIFDDSEPEGPQSTQVLDTSARDDLRGAVGAENFVMLNDGQDDLLRNFEIGVDKIDLTEFGALSFEDLTISNVIRGNGSVSWIAVFDPDGERELLVRYDGDTPLDAGALSAEDFTFSTVPVERDALKIQDLDGRDKLRGTDAAEDFVMLDDGQSDLVFGFEIGQDKFDVGALGVAGFDELVITNMLRRDGSVSWVSVSDMSGDREMQVRFAADIELDATSLSADDFLFV